MKGWIKKTSENYWVRFFGRTLLYFMVLMVLIYLYHYRNIQGGSFIYNEF